MTRSRLCIACALRLAIYLAAIMVVHHADPPAAGARLAASLDPSASGFTGPVIAVLLLGSLLEVLSGVVRWR